MRRQDIQLLALARQGDAAARCEAGRRYLLGIDGFPRHVATGLDYLSHANVRELPQAARIIAESLTLEDIVELRQEAALTQAASQGSAPAQIKLAAWSGLRLSRADEAARWLTEAIAAGQSEAAPALAALQAPGSGDAVSAMLQALTQASLLDGAAVARLAARQALAAHEVARAAGALRTSIALAPAMTLDLAELVAQLVQQAEAARETLHGLAATALEDALDMRSSRGDREAAYALGRALCGIDVGVIPADALAAHPNMRKGVALLLRAADAGRTDAWMHLYRVHGDHSHSVANPQMARFCLEKAALAGQVHAQRKLGALMLRGSDSLDDSESAIAWLHQAAAANDLHARTLLQSLVLPLDSDSDEDADALAAIELIGRDDPWLAMRMELGRHFGLTKLEALCVDPLEGERPWGLVVGKNPFISQIRLSAPRAIPSTTPEAADALRRAVALFGQAGRDAFEGDLRRRSLRQRRAFERHGIEESMFFANATSMALEALRFGPKWAFKEKGTLQLALA